ncbi:MAG: OsmC family protein [Flavobacteriales bacterium]
MKVELKRKNQAFHYEAKAGEHVVNIDGNPSIGGEDKGARPMEILLMGVAGCASIDLGLILKKQKQELEDYSVEITGKRDKDDAKAFNAIHLVFKLKGGIDEKKANRAAELAVTKYCSAIKSLKMSIKVTFEVIIRA